jgi:hypothetical protein
MMRKCVNFFSIAIVLSCLFFQNALAQPVPCSGDPDDAGFDPNNCPLDTWVWFFAGIAFVFTVIHLYKKDAVLKSPV